MVGELRTQVTDQGAIGKYFALMLHIDDDDLDPYEYRLLGHYRRVCGATNKPCFESTLTTAKITRMSDDKVRSTRDSLEALGRIIVEKPAGSTVKVTVCDLMAENVERHKPNPSRKQEGLTLDTPPENRRGGLPKTGVKEESYKKKEYKDSSAPASQDASDATPFPDAPKGFQWVASANSDQPLAHLTTGCITGPLQCKGKLYNRDFYRTWEKKNPRQPCLECLRVAEEKLKPKQPKPRQPDAVFDAIALGSFGMSKTPNGSGGRIGKLKNGVIECGMLPDDTPLTLATDLADMYVWYKRVHSNLSAPASVETICKYLAEYRQSRRVVADDEHVKFVEHDSYVAPSEVR
jgi:hypothetical protein